MIRPNLSLLTIAFVWTMQCASAEPESTDVIIVGAGVAGLTTAYELQKHGLRTRVLEMQSVVGGRVATADYGNGLTAEYGMQEIWAGNPLTEIARELGVELVLDYEHCAHSTFMVDGVIFPDIYDGTMRAHWDSFLPPEDRLALENWLDAAKQLYARATTVGITDPAIRALQDMSYEDWVSSDPRLSPLAQAWLRLHMEAELASDWSRLSALYVLLEMNFLFEGGAACYSVDGGNSRLIEALADAAGPVTTAARVTNIRREVGSDNELPVHVSYIRNNVVHTLRGRRVVLAVPFYGLHQINIEPPLPAAYHRSLQTLGLAHYVVVHIIMNVGGTTIATPDGVAVPNVILTNGPLGFVYGVVSENESKAVFSLLVYGESARQFHMVPRDVKVAELLTMLDEIQPGFSEHVDDTYVYSYHPAAIASWQPGRSPLDEQSELLREPADGLYLVGDYTLGGHSDAAARSAISAASRITAELAPGGGMMSCGPGLDRRSGSRTSHGPAVDCRVE